MNSFLVILCFAVVPAMGFHWSPGWKATFGSFEDLPQSSSEATAKNWTSVTGPTLPTGYGNVTLWCPSTGYTLCVYFDNTDYPAGLQISLDTDYLSGAAYSLSAQGFTEWNITVNGVEKTYYTTFQFYVSASGLAEDSATRLANRNNDTMLQEGAIWVTGFNGELYKIPSNYTEFLKDTNFTEEACIPFMGLHYYYNMTTSTTCGADTMFLWFPLYQSGQLIAVGFYNFGVYTTPSDETTWFESPTTTAVKVIVPTGPQCFFDLCDSPGVFTMHTYFIKYPLLVNCLIQ